MGFLRTCGAYFFGLSDADGAGAEPSPEAIHAKYTILAIDDDDSFLQVLRATLCQAGFNVLSTTSGPKGLNMLRYAPKDIGLVLLDYSMPGFDGEKTLEYVRQLNPKVKIVGLTGTEASFVPAAFRQNVDQLIQKPFRAADLIQSLTVLLTSGAASAHASTN